MSGTDADDSHTPESILAQRPVRFATFQTSDSDADTEDHDVVMDIDSPSADTPLEYHDPLLADSHSTDSPESSPSLVPWGGLVDPKSMSPLPSLYASVDDFDASDPDDPTTNYPPRHHRASPFKAPPEVGKISLWDLLMSLRLPPLPPFYVDKKQEGKTVLGGTKKLSFNDIPLARQLKAIVPVVDMFRDIRRELRSKVEPITLRFGKLKDRDYLSIIHPYFTSLVFPGLVHCEKDVEVSTAAMICRAALAVVHAALLGTIPSGLHQDRDAYFSSAVQKSEAGAVIPDLILVQGSLSFPNENIRLRGEIKSSNVLNVVEPSARASVRAGLDVDSADTPAPEHADESDAESDIAQSVREAEAFWSPSGIVSSDEESLVDVGGDEDSVRGMNISVDARQASEPGHLFDAIQRMTVREGYAAKFEYPTKAKVERLQASKKRVLSKPTKVISQVWEQLLEETARDEALNFLSSFDTTTFVVRQKDVMFISKNYQHNDSHLLLDMACMIYYALGHSEAQLNLPTPNTQWWSDKVHRAADNCVGIVKQSLVLPPESS